MTRQPSTRPAEPRTAAIRKALGVGFVSWDGDGWYATQGENGVGYDEAEQAFKDAYAALDAIEAEAAAPAALDVERLTEAMDFDRVEAQAIIRKHGFVFARNLAEVTDDSDEAARWEKLAFTLYTMLLPSNRRSEKIAAEYARLRQGTEEER